MEIISVLLFALLTCILAFRFLMVLGIAPKFLKQHFSPATTLIRTQPLKLSATSKVFLLSLGLRMVLLWAAVTIVMLQSNDKISVGECFQRMQRWDAIHYTKLIDEGYWGYIENDQHLFLVFFPGYVWLTRMIRLLIPNTIAAGIAVSCFCYAGGCCFLFKLVEEYYNSTIAKDSVIYLSLFPFSLFYGFVMTEGLFLLTITAACFYAHQKKWLLFGVWGFFAALTRMTGVLVIIPAVIELAFNQDSKTSFSKRVVFLIRKVPQLMMPLLGTGVYLLLNAAVDGNPLAFLTHQKHWYQGFMWFPKVVQYVWRLSSECLHTSIGWSIWLPTIIMFFLFLVILLIAGTDSQNPLSLLAFALCYFIVSYSLSWLLSAGRYLSCCFPLFVFLAKLTENKSLTKRFLQIIETVFLGVYLFAYLSGAQVM